MRATFSFQLPDDQAEFDAARLGPAALALLSQIDARLRSLVKYEGGSVGEVRLAEEIRQMIPAELLEGH
jgi:hypothetical protein